MYQNSYGLDDVRKPEFMLQATAWQYEVDSEPEQRRR